MGRSQDSEDDIQETRKATAGPKVIEPAAALVKIVVSERSAIPGVGLWERWQKTTFGGTSSILLNTGVLSTANVMRG